MIKFENGKTPINDTNLNNMQIELLKLVFPVGATYTTPTNTNPGELLGFGTWERFNGKNDIGINENDVAFNSVGKTGGNKEITLERGNLPDHTHLVYGRVLSAQSGSGVQFREAAEEASAENNVQSGVVGNGVSINIMNPYEVTGYKWIRRA